MLNALDTFNIIAGLVGVASLVFSAWIYLDARRKEGIERERLAALHQHLNHTTQLLSAIGSQASLIATISDREETSKKELKHLALAILSTTEALRETLRHESEARSKWKFGVPSRYVNLQQPPVGSITRAADNP